MLPYRALNFGVVGDEYHECSGAHWEK